MALNISYMAIPGVDRIFSCHRLIEIVCKKTGIDIKDLKGKSRKREIVEARQLAFYILKKNTRLPFAVIGGMLNRDHTTVIHSIKVVTALKETDKEYISKYSFSC